ncbi:MAG: hypothetical protein ACYC28_04560 [Longimicrobiales bacterium]
MTETATIDRSGAHRVTALERAFRTLARDVPGMSVDVVGHVRGQRRLVHPVAGFTVRLDDAASSAGASLYVSAAYGELSLWRNGSGEGVSAKEQFNVRLNEGFVWGDSEYPDATPLAADLLGYLQFNMDRVRDARG